LEQMGNTCTHDEACSERFITRTTRFEPEFHIDPLEEESFPLELVYLNFIIRTPREAQPTTPTTSEVQPMMMQKHEVFANMWEIENLQVHIHQPEFLQRDLPRLGLSSRGQPIDACSRSNRKAHSRPKLSPAKPRTDDNHKPAQQSHPSCLRRCQGDQECMQNEQQACTTEPPKVSEVVFHAERGEERLGAECTQRRSAKCKTAP